MPQPKSTMDSGDHTQIVRPLTDRPQDTAPMDQLVIRDEDGEDRHFQLFPGMRPEQLGERVAAAGISDFEVAWLHCDEAVWEECRTLVQAAWPGKGFRELAATPPGVSRVDGRVSFIFSDHYFRAVAKIAFHYYLVHTRRGIRGDEPEFAPIRRFILEGGDSSTFFDVSGPKFVVPFGELLGNSAITPSQWCHVLAVHEESQAVVAYVYLFAGPGCVRYPHHIRLGPLRSRIILPGGVWGHVYLYDKTQRPVGTAGRVVPVTVSRIR